MTTLSSFEPVEDSNCKILVLGTMPGEESLRRQEYYGYKHNAFWSIMGKYLGFNIELPYEQRCAEIRKAGIGLWDTLAKCERKGSLDTNIKNVQANDIKDFIDGHFQLKCILFNGGNAELYFKKYILKSTNDSLKDIELLKMPSTSPTNARMNFDSKYKVWAKALSAILI